MKTRILKTLSALLAVVLLVTATPLSGFVGLDISDFDIFSVKAEAASSGKCGDNVKWKLDDEGTLTISGTGKMYDYISSSNIPWVDKRSEIKKGIIKKGVTNIAFATFWCCTGLKSVEIANSVKAIDNSAFAYCENLKTIEIPDSVETIGYGAFEGCKKLSGLTIPSNVTLIDFSAFSNCASLKNINVSSKNNYYSSKNGVLFNKDKTALICYPSGKTTTSYTIPNSVTAIYGYAFAYCDNLENISISKNVCELGGNYSFPDCPNLKNIDVSSDNKWYSSKNGVLFDKNKTTLIKYPGGKSSTSYTVPDSVKYINDYAFRCSNKLTSVKIQNGVKEIGQWAFGDCKKLKNITIGNNVTDINSYAFSNTAYYNDSSNWKNGILYLGNYLIAVEYWESGYSTNGSCTIKSGTKLIANDAFMYCNELKSITIPDSVLYIGDYAFQQCSNLKSVKIGKNVKNIGWAAFSHCPKLKSVTIPKSVKSIGVFAFGYEDYDNKISDFKIYGQKGSAAETYAKENGFKFVSDSSSHSHSYTSKVTKKATTSKSGTQKFTCSCGKSYTKTIAKISSVKLSKTSYTYNGEAKKPTVTVKDSNGNKLKKGTDYTVSYSSGRKSIGTYAVTVTFKGKYSGSKKLTFKIVPGKVTGVKQQNKKGINFKWNAVKGADGYQVYKYDSAKKKYVQLKTTENPSCGNSSAKGSMKIKIRAYKIKGDRLYYGAFSDPKTFTAKK